MADRIVQIYAVRNVETDQLEALVRTITTKRAVDRHQKNLHYARPATQRDMYEGGMGGLLVKEENPPLPPTVDPRQLRIEAPEVGARAVIVDNVDNTLDAGAPA